MWLAPLVQVLVLAAVEPAAGGNPPAVAPAANVPTFYSRQALFVIPFHLNRPARGVREPVEVQLYSSTNRGAAWQLYGKVEPAKGRFLFHAPADGEYWFSVSTVDRFGQAPAAAPSTPGLIVFVDTVVPKLQITARRGPTGETIVHWQVDELHPKSGSLVLQYRGAPTMPWQSIRFDRPEPGAAGPVASGEVTLYPPADVAQLELRGEVLDMAGNAGVGQAKIELRDLGPPALPPPGSPGTAAPPTAIAIPPTPVPPAGNDARQPPPALQADDPWRPGSEPLPANGPATVAPAGGQAAADRNPAAQDWPASPLRPAAGQTRVEISDHGQTASQDGSVAVQINPAASNRLVAADGQNSLRSDTAGGPPRSPADPTAGSAAAGGVPAGQRLHMVNTRIFELDYDLQSVGPSGVKQVELWGTRDGGRNWKRYTVDQTKRSPLVVTVAEAGTYGFRILAESGAGLGGRPPQSGDLPEIYVGVDLTKPTVRITSAEQGSGAEAANLNIAWQASDDVMLAQRPITIAFSQSPGGPWIPVASGLENSGHYAWAIDNRIPLQVYLRIEARDEAGNIGAYTTPEPVSLDQMRPKAHIREVHPVGQSSQRIGDTNYVR